MIHTGPRHQEEISKESEGSFQSQTFNLRATPGTKVQNGQVVAELIDDRYRTTTGGMLKFAGIEVQKKGKAKLGYEVVSGGTLLWIPEETHEVNKDISLLLVEDGQFVEASTEVVKDIFCQTSGVVEITQKNDILREIVIKPGELLMVDDPEAVLGRDNTFVHPGEELLGTTVTEMRYIQYVESPEGPALLSRPVVEFQVSSHPDLPSTTSVSQQTGRSIQLRAVQRLPYKDGERVKAVDGVELLRTQLVLEIEQEGEQDHTSPLAADIELVPDSENPEIQRLQLVIENSGAELGYLLIENQQNWRIKASGKINSQAVVVDFPISLEGDPSEKINPVLEAIPNTIVNYVARTQRPVLLDDAHLNHRFFNDQYLQRNQPKSVLCLPLIHQNKLLGLLYLENNLVKGVFTDDRLRTLQIITTQAAISLENAQLYNQITSYSKTLEIKVKLRTEELEMAKEAADRANQSKSEFLSNMSHELRTPLNAILGFTQIMNRDASLSVEQRENLDIINRSGEHLLTLINDILDLSKIDAGNMSIDRESFDLYSLLHTLEQMLSVKAKNKNLELIFDLSPDLPQYVQADAKKLRQILLNLLSSAIKFTPGGIVTGKQIGRAHV